MRRDICFYYPEDVITIYNAFLTAAKNPPFERTCSQQPYHTFQFGLNYSVKYNMNGGSLTLHFMPYNNGTAVNLRFSIAQLAGAKCDVFANDLAYYACSRLGLRSQYCSVDIEEFLKPENQVTMQNRAPSPTPTPFAPSVVNVTAPVAPSAPTERLTPDSAVVTPPVAPAAPVTPPPSPRPVYTQPAPQFSGRRCTKCGAPMATNARFCISCGTSYATSTEWICTCGRNHPAYVTSCSCGQTKRNVTMPQTTVATETTAPTTTTVPTQRTATATNTAPVDESVIISTLRQYKELLDSGIITQEEFDLKKQSLLNK